MTRFKLTIILTLITFFGCKTNKKQIVFKWDNGKPKLERVYSDTPNCFVEKEYYDNGQLKSETKFIDSTKNGESIDYYKDGKLLGKCIYRNGEINGEVTEFHKTGELMFKGHQKDGNLIGTAIHYYDNGKPESELYYKDKKAFLVNYWDSSFVQTVFNGKGFKKFQEELNRDKNGKDTTLNVLVIGTYKDSLHNGLWKFYNLVENKLVLERTFKDDKVISETWK